MQLARQDVVGLLRKVNMQEMAEEAHRVLPDPVDSEQVAAWSEKHGITMSELVSRMGGSP